MSILPVSFYTSCISRLIEECREQVGLNHYYNLNPRFSFDIINITALNIQCYASRILNFCEQIQADSSLYEERDAIKKLVIQDFHAANNFLIRFMQNEHNHSVQFVPSSLGEEGLSKINSLNQELWNYKSQPILFFLEEMTSFINDFNALLIKYVWYQKDPAKFEEINAFMDRSFAALENIKTRNLGNGDCLNSDFIKAQGYLQNIKIYLGHIMQFWATKQK